MFGLFIFIGVICILGGIGMYALTYLELHPEVFSEIMDKLPFKISDFIKDLSQASKISLIIIGVGFVLVVLNIIFIHMKRKKKKGKKEETKSSNNKVSNNSSKDLGVTYKGNKCYLKMKVYETNSFKESWERLVNTILNRGYDKIDNFGYKDTDLWMEFSSSLSISELKEKENNPDDKHRATIKNSDERSSRTFKTRPYNGVVVYESGNRREIYDGDVKVFTRDYMNTYALLIDGKYATYSQNGYTYRVDVEYRHIEPDGEVPFFKDKNLFPEQFSAMFVGSGYNCVGYRYAGAFELDKGSYLTEIGLEYSASKNNSTKCYGEDATIRRIFESNENVSLLSYVRNTKNGRTSAIEDQNYYSLEICCYSDEYFLAVGRDISSFTYAYEELINTGEEYNYDENSDELPLVTRLDYNGSLREVFDWSFHKYLAEELSDRYYFAEDSMKVILDLVKNKKVKKILNEYLREIFNVNIED